VHRGAGLDVDGRLLAARGDPMDAHAIEELARVDRAGAEEERLAAGGSGVRGVDLRAVLAREPLAVRRPGLADLIGDDLPGGAGGRHSGRAEVREQGEDERADDDGEAEAR